MDDSMSFGPLQMFEVIVGGCVIATVPNNMLQSFLSAICLQGHTVEVRLHKEYDGK